MEIIFWLVAAGVVLVALVALWVAVRPKSDARRPSPGRKQRPMGEQRTG